MDEDRKRELGIGPDRAGDGDREKVLDQLKSGFASGHLSLDVYQARMQATMEAVTRNDLEEMTSDFPVPSIVPAPEILLEDPAFNYLISRAKTAMTEEHKRVNLNMVQIGIGFWTAALIVVMGRIPHVWGPMQSVSTELGFNQVILLVSGLVFMLNLMIATQRWVGNRRNS